MARKKQETLVLFPEVLQITRKFTDAQFGALIRAVFSYRFGGEEYSGDDMAIDVAFQAIANQVDRLKEYSEINAKNAAGSESKQGGAECSEMQGNHPPILSNPILYRESGYAGKPPTHPHFLSVPALENGRAETALFFPLLPLRLVGQIGAGPKQGSAQKADLPADGKGLVLIAQRNGMGSLGHMGTDHTVPYQGDLCLFPIHIQVPVAILRNRRIEESIPVTVDGALHPCLAEGGNIQGSGI